MADDKKPTAPPQKPIAKRKDEDKLAKQAAKEARANHKEDIKENAGGIDRLSNLLKLQNTSIAAQTKIDKLAHMGQTDQANNLQELLAISQKSFEDAPKNANNIAARLKELSDIESQATSINEIASKTSNSSLQNIIDQNVEMSKIASANPNQIRRSIDKLEARFTGETNEATIALREAFETNTGLLETAIKEGDLAGQELAREQLEMIGEGAKSEESRREATALAEEQSSALFLLGDKFEVMGESFDKAIGENARKAGFFAGLAGLALMFLDPEKFQELVTAAIDSISGIFDTLYAAITGDWEGFSSGFSENWKAIGAILLGIGAMFGGKILSLAGSLLKAARAFKIFMMTKFIPTISNMFSGMISALGGAFMKLVRGVVIGAKVFRVFMMGTMIPAIGAMFTGMMTAMVPILAAMAPILLPILAIAAAFGLLFLGIKAIRDAMGFGSMFDVIKVAWGYVKDGMAMFANVYIDIANMIMGLVSKFGKWLGFDFEMPQMDRMATDNAEKAKEAARLNKKRLDEEKALEKEREIESELNAQNPTIPGSDILNTSDSNSAGQKESATSVNAIIQNTTGGNVSKNSKVTSNVIQSPITKATSTLASVTSR